jgi:5S rRNA maturation endonuclease (ribonuclease M5)
VIICEGKDDAYFIDKLCTEIGADVERVGVVYSSGGTNIEQEVDLLMKSSSFVAGTTERVIIIRDSDSDGPKNLSRGNVSCI